jgi:hypothetical protein
MTKIATESSSNGTIGRTGLSFDFEVPSGSRVVCSQSKPDAVPITEIGYPEKGQKFELEKSSEDLFREFSKGQPQAFNLSFKTPAEVSRLWNLK